ncbi:MAG: hypothetical protein HOI95_08825 [Chromatiales bacterium]|jgi:P-type Cu+ transporter|nr:hypothetical protein [Chromatiales bacterium]
MHPEVIQDAPGDCPLCGMALEPMTVTLTEADDSELRDMTHRLLVSAALKVPLFVVAMSAVIGLPLDDIIAPRPASWLELLLATPVVLWGGWPFFVKGVRSVANRHLNMFTLIALGTGVAYVYSVIVTLVLLGQVMELRARNQSKSLHTETVDKVTRNARSGDASPPLALRGPSICCPTIGR